ncbi:hypothetical protein LXL04_019468 [Taraxacum kok-saghyz]
MDGIFSVGSFRREFDDKYVLTCPLETIWIKEVPRKINVVVWRLRLNRILTKDNLAARGIILPSDVCPACSRCLESAAHLFLECSTARGVMATIKRRWDKLPDLSSNTDIEELLKGGTNLNSDTERLKYVVIIRAFLWIIWCNRNDVSFNAADYGFIRYQTKSREPKLKQPQFKEVSCENEDAPKGLDLSLLPITTPKLPTTI